jgi:hypothetical protein
MDYQGPTSDDLANISALNRCFLMAVSGSEADGLGEIAARRLTDSQVSRLAGAPFLLFSFREQDTDYWQRLLSEDRQLDLIELSKPLDERIRQLQVAGLAFIWQLSRRNPYTSRIISGAPVSWCERLAESTLIQLLDRAAHRSDLLRIRFQDKSWVWRRLLDNGVSAQRHLRQTSHQCALQVLLTYGRNSQYDRVPAAACNMRTPATQEGPRRSTGFRETKV